MSVGIMLGTPDPAESLSFLLLSLLRWSNAITDALASLAAFLAADPYAPIASLAATMPFAALMDDVYVVPNSEDINVAIYAVTLAKADIKAFNAGKTAL